MPLFGQKIFYCHQGSNAGVMLQQSYISKWTFSTFISFRISQNEKAYLLQLVIGKQKRRKMLSLCWRVIAVCRIPIIQFKKYFLAGNVKFGFFIRVQENEIRVHTHIVGSKHDGGRVMYH